MSRPENNSSSGVVSSDISPDYILDRALEIALNILKNGGETHRTEDTVERICLHFGAESVEVFVLPSVLIAQIKMADGKIISQTRRLFSSSYDLYALEQVNNISRDLCNDAITLDEVQDEIDKIKNSKPFPRFLIYIGGILAAGGFVVFFGGNIFDAVCAAIASLFISYLEIHRVKFVNVMLHTFFASFLSALCAILLVHFNIGQHIDIVLIGTIMLLIPGLAFGNSVRDLLLGDTISGLVQLVKSVLLAVIIAFGFAAPMMLLGGVLNI